MQVMLNGLILMKQSHLRALSDPVLQTLLNFHIEIRQVDKHKKIKSPEKRKINNVNTVDFDIAL